jgi:hypothetical protein
VNLPFVVNTEYIFEVLNNAIISSNSFRKVGSPPVSHTASGFQSDDLEITLAIFKFVDLDDSGNEVLYFDLECDKKQYWHLKLHLYVKAHIIILFVIGLNPRFMLSKIISTLLNPLPECQNTHLTFSHGCHC